MIRLALTAVATSSLRTVRNEPTYQPLLRMPDDLRTQIAAEIERVQSEIDQQKTLIKKKHLEETRRRNS